MISPKTIAAIRERTDIAAVVAETVKLVRKGRNLIGLCPFHKETTPSFGVSPERGFYYCFGCKEHGNVFDFVMKVEGLTFPEAARKLADRHPRMSHIRRPDEHTRKQRARRIDGVVRMIRELNRGRTGSTRRDIAEVYWQEVNRWRPA